MDARTLFYIKVNFDQFRLVQKQFPHCPKVF